MGYDDDDDDDFDYEDFVEREFGRPRRSKDVPGHWQVVAMLLLVAFVFTLWASMGFWTPF
ncbi:hypothetical protein [Roseiconus nitratireducens]|uniref:hypothetical protein n=1 Tax=Roseiconus nitratireducens TaxID=2605748 RepID=UPI0013761161|nr:hypothetical protein [Roseiconus nitratireducens]